MTIESFKIIIALVILATTYAAAWFPLRRQTVTPMSTTTFEAIASGIFLGAGLLHMLAHASHIFTHLHWHYPIAFLLAGIVFLMLLLLEHISRELHHQPEQHHRAIIGLTVGMLSLHSVLAGMALGVTHELATATLVAIAILSHKWATSFALGVQITRHQVQRRWQLFSLYALMAPLGILIGGITSQSVNHNSAWVAALGALSAGTFLYIGTLHGLKRAVMVDKCCNLKQFFWVIAGFSVMAGLATWA